MGRRNINRMNFITKYLLSRKLKKQNQRGLEIQNHLMNMHNIIDFNQITEDDFD